MSRSPSLVEFLLARFDEDYEIASEFGDAALRDEATGKILITMAASKAIKRFPKPEWFSEAADWSVDRPYVLRCLSLRYTSHPDYREEWTP